MTKNRCLMIVVAGGLGTLVLPAWAAKQRIDLAEFGRVVHFPQVPTKVTTSQQELSRGTDGWEVVRDEDGQYSIGVEWDEPRDISEVNIEFRHAIADREAIRAQYWQVAESGSRRGGAKKGKLPAGRWMTPKADWWAGDRDVSFAFGPQDREAAGKNEPGTVVRRTTRLRFLCGKEDLPPVRYLRVYGPGKVVVDTFDVRFDPKSKLSLPVAVEVVNGFALSADGKDTLDSTTLRDAPVSLLLRYFRDDESSSNSTEVRLSPADKPDIQYKFLPAKVAHRGPVRIEEAGVVVERRGGILASTQPARNAGAKAAPLKSALPNSTKNTR